jgi:hypothetical protein
MEVHLPLPGQAVFSNLSRAEDGIVIDEGADVEVKGCKG